MTRAVREVAGYVVGFALFVVLVPAAMWLVAGSAELGGGDFGVARCVTGGVLACAGLGLSVWSIVHMRLVGRGNPLDAFDHEVAPRTSVLMTDGPYALCRNPMLLGVLVYYVGVLVVLGSVRAVAVFVVYCLVMAVQVSREERRLRSDFGPAYDEYCRQTNRLLPRGLLLQGVLPRKQD